MFRGCRIFSGLFYFKADPQFQGDIVQIPVSIGDGGALNWPWVNRHIHPENKETVFHPFPERIHQSVVRAEGVYGRIYLLVVLVLHGFLKRSVFHASHQ